MPLITLRNAELAYGLHPLLDRADLSVEAGERVGLIGRNGTGKSSLLQAIAARIALDDGEVARQDGLRIVFVEQEPELPQAATLRESLIARGGIEIVHLEARACGCDERRRRSAAAQRGDAHRQALSGISRSKREREGICNRAAGSRRE